jgi:hypothetical protein
MERPTHVVGSLPIFATAIGAHVLNRFGEN